MIEERRQEVALRNNNEAAPLRVVELNDSEVRILQFHRRQEGLIENGLHFVHEQQPGAELMQARHGAQLGCQMLLQLHELAVRLRQLVHAPDQMVVEIEHRGPAGLVAQDVSKRRKREQIRLPQQTIAQSAQDVLDDPAAPGSGSRECGGQVLDAACEPLDVVRVRGIHTFL